LEFRPPAADAIHCGWEIVWLAMRRRSRVEMTCSADIGFPEGAELALSDPISARRWIQSGRDVDGV